MIDSQDTVCGILSPDGPNEFEEATPLSTRILIVYNSNRLWRPRSPQEIPPRSTMSLPKLEAATLATMLNRRAMLELLGKALPVPSIEWAVVARGKLGFHVVKVTADMRCGWRPDTPYDIPDGTLGPGKTMKRADAQRTAKEFNSQQIAICASPVHWALPVKEITEDDLVDRAQCLEEIAA